MYNTYPIPTAASRTALLLRATNDIARRRDRTSTDKTKFEYSAGFSSSYKACYQRRRDRSKMNVLPLRTTAKVRDIPHIGNSGKLT